MKIRGIKISKLYIKIFLSVLVGLLLAEVVTFATFRSIFHRGYRAEFGAIADAQATLARSFIDGRLAAGDSLFTIVVSLGTIVRANVWALDENEQVLAASVHRQLPDLDDVLEHSHRTREGLRFDFEDDALYALLPVSYPGQQQGYFLFEFRIKLRHIFCY